MRKTDRREKKKITLARKINQTGKQGRREEKDGKKKKRRERKRERKQKGKRRVGVQRLQKRWSTK